MRRSEKREGSLTRDGAVFLWGSVYDRASHSMLPNSHELRGERDREGERERGGEGERGERGKTS